MTVNEAIEELKNENEQCYEQCEGCCSEVENNVCTCRDATILSVLEQYRAIGTIEECQKAVEKGKRKNPIILREQSAESEGKLYIAKYFKSPTCGSTSTYFGGLPNNCHNCGQSLESGIS